MTEPVSETPPVDTAKAPLPDSKKDSKSKSKPKSHNISNFIRFKFFTKLFHRKKTKIREGTKDASDELPTEKTQNRSDEKAATVKFLPVDEGGEKIIREKKDTSEEGAARELEQEKSEPDKQKPEEGTDNAEDGATKAQEDIDAEAVDYLKASGKVEFVTEKPGTVAELRNKLLDFERKNKEHYASHVLTKSKAVEFVHEDEEKKKLALHKKQEVSPREVVTSDSSPSSFSTKNQTDEGAAAENEAFPGSTESCNANKNQGNAEVVEDGDAGKGEAATETAKTSVTDKEEARKETMETGQGEKDAKNVEVDDAIEDKVAVETSEADVGDKGAAETTEAGDADKADGPEKALETNETKDAHTDLNPSIETSSSKKNKNAKSLIRKLSSRRIKRFSGKQSTMASV